MTLTESDLAALPTGAAIISTTKNGRYTYAARKRGNGNFDLHMVGSAADRAKVVAGTTRGIDENKPARGILFTGDNWSLLSV